jgi:predicted enzyme related to lactoylglutathione lyase
MAHHHHRVDYIEFPATDIPATKAFYGSAFGWSFTDYGPDYIAFEGGQVSGGFTKVQANKAGGPLVILYSSQLEKTQAVVEASGGRVTRAIFSFPGGRRFHFLDPNGNELAVWSEE